MGMGYGFRKRHELILVLEKGKPTYNDMGFPNVLDIQRVDATKRPHTKPIALIAALIKQSTVKGGLVLDPFLGSGTTAIAALKLNRRFIGIECHYHYANLARSMVKAANVDRRHLLGHLKEKVN
jgi:site-specific DNA-methyltransferase (adenine-specific)